jgi:hypothetical protein
VASAVMELATVFSIPDPLEETGLSSMLSDCGNAVSSGLVVVIGTSDFGADMIN